MRRGVHAIELVLIVAIVALLVAIAAPWFTRSEHQQAVYDARTTLERLRDAEDAYFAKNHQYTADLAKTQYTPPADVHLVVAGAGLADGRGWNGTASTTGATCYIGVGVDTVVGSIHTGDGHVVCP